jgi:hypothetical protein
MPEKFICPYCEGLLTEKYYCISCKKDFSLEAARAKKGTLPDYQIAQQDYIDNACFHFLKEFVPISHWDIAQISIIRDALISVLIKFHNKKEYDLYPWLLESEEEKVSI